MTFLPSRIRKDSGRKDAGKRSPAHRSWIRGFHCVACGSSVAIECAHVRSGTDGGTGIKPSDRWCVSFCKECHSLQHRIGEPAFEKRFGINLKELAEAFFKRSPHRHKLEQADG